MTYRLLLLVGLTLVPVSASAFNKTYANMMGIRHTNKAAVRWMLKSSAHKIQFNKPTFTKSTTTPGWWNFVAVSKKTMANGKHEVVKGVVQPYLGGLIARDAQL